MTDTPGRPQIPVPAFTRQERHDFEQVRYCGLDERNMQILDTLVGSLLERIEAKTEQADLANHALEAADELALAANVPWFADNQHPNNESSSHRLGVALMNYDLTRKLMAEQKDTRAGYNRLWDWFGMSYASFAVIPRVLMHAMPDAWQGRMALLLEQYDHAFPAQPDVGTRVMFTNLAGSKLVSGPKWMLNYRHPDSHEIERVRGEGR